MSLEKATAPLTAPEEAFLRNLEEGGVFRFVPGDDRKAKLEKRFGSGSWETFRSLAESGRLTLEGVRSSRGKEYITFVIPTKTMP